MKYMERRGSGLKKILTETKKLPGYTDKMRPEFYSTPTDFRVVLKNVNYIEGNGQDNGQDDGQDIGQDEWRDRLVDFCSESRTREEMQNYMGISSKTSFRRIFLKPLLKSGKLKMTLPDKPNSGNQKYIKA
jgi:ATP-dependent DNA helicase RecG